jgi:uncharacterized protein (DUF608 family)
MILLQRAKRHFTTALLENHHKVNIDIKIRKLEKNVAGLVYHSGLFLDDKRFTIEISETLSKSKMITTLAHEMVHVKQFLEGQLELKRAPFRILWNGKDLTDLKYTKRPWEIEAHALEGELYKGFMNGD